MSSVTVSSRAARKGIAGAVERGFTLIELMIVVVIVAILGSIALPLYTEYVERAQRNDAKAVLLEAAQYMERKFTETGTYLGITLPPSFSQSPREGGPRYTIAINSRSASAYELRATPISTPRKCGALITNQLGQRSVGDAN